VTAPTLSPVAGGPLAPPAAAPITVQTGAPDAVPPNVLGLRCGACGATQPVDAVHVCSACFGPLEVDYDEELQHTRVTRARIEAGPRSLWRYVDLLPVLDADPGLRVDLGTGVSPLRPAPRLAARLGLRELWLKDDTRNPSGSFKDRVVTTALSAARAFGLGTVACASTGNLATSVAAHAAASGLDAYVFVPADLEASKIVGAAVYGARVVAIDGTYDEVNRLAAEVADERGWGFVNVNLRPFYAEGSKTIAFEVVEQLGWRFPDHVVAPVASGAMYVKQWQACAELRRFGLVDGPLPRFSGAQAAGCSPVATAFGDGTDRVVPQIPDTIARSLAIGDPADGDVAIKVARETGGVIGAVTDDEVVAGIRLLAETEGIFAETAGGVTVANLVRFAEAGVLGADERTVAIISGNGYKTIDAVSSVADDRVRIAPSLDAFRAAIPADAQGTC
jgi:threonine synthase